MTFDQFIQTMAEAEKKFKAAIREFPEKDDEFLSKCRLAVTRDSKHFDFRKKLSVSDISDRMILIKDSEIINNLISLTESLKEALEAAKRKQKQEDLALKEKIKRIETELNSFPIDQLEFHDDFDIQVIFPSVNSEIIQSLKGHPLVSKTKTCMCRACIRVFFY